MAVSDESMLQVDNSMGEMIDAAEESAWPKPSLAWLVVIVLSMTFALSMIDRYMLTLLLDSIKKDLLLSDTQLGLLQGVAFAAIYSLVGLPMGYFVDRSRRRNLIAIGVILWSSMTVLCAFATNYPILFIGRMGLGLGEAALTPAALSLIGDYFSPVQRARAMSVYLAGASAGIGLALILGGRVIEIADYGNWLLADFTSLQFRPWQFAFLLVGAPGILFGMCAWAIPEPKRRDRATRGVTVGFAPLLAFLRQRQSLLYYFIGGMTLCSICSYSYTSWIPTWIIRVLGWTPAETGATYGSLVLVAQIVGMLGGGYVSDMLLKRGDEVAPIRVVIVSLAGFFGTALIAPHLQNPAAAMASFFLLNVFAAAPFAIAPAVLISVSPNEVRGQVSAIYMFAISAIGLSLGPAVVGLLNDVVFTGRQGITMSLTVVGAVTLPLSLLFLILALRRYRAALHEPARLS
jgi:MFS family permease